MNRIFRNTRFQPRNLCSSSQSLKERYKSTKSPPLIWRRKQTIYSCCPGTANMFTMAFALKVSYGLGATLECRDGSFKLRDTDECLEFCSYSRSLNIYIALLPKPYKYYKHCPGLSFYLMKTKPWAVFIVLVWFW